MRESEQAGRHDECQSLKIRTEELRSLGRNFAGKKVAVFGGTGFLGGWISAALEYAGADVTAVGRKLQIPVAGVRFRRMDVTTLKNGRLPELDYAFFSVLPFRNAEMQKNLPMVVRTIEGLIRVLQHANAIGTKVVLASSGSVYGNRASRVKENAPVDVTTANAAYHHGLESFFRVACEGKAPLITRHFTIYGPGESKRQLVGYLLDSALKKRRLRIKGASNERRDFVFVEDAALSTILLAANRRASGLTVNVSSGRETTVKDLVKTVRAVTSCRLDARYSSKDAANPASITGDNSLLRTLTALQFTPLHDGISRTWDWLTCRS